MIPVAFGYHRPETLDEALALLGELGDEAKVLAGGHSLIPMMKLRLAAPLAVVDVGRLHSLRYVRDGGDHLAIGALTRHHDLETDSLVAQRVPVLRSVAHLVGDPQVRHRGTLGGTLAHADPAGDLAAVAVALDATIVVAGTTGRREVPAGDLATGYFETTLAPEEMIVEIKVPYAEAGEYQKFTRRAQDWAVVGSLAVRSRGTLRVALVNMGATTIRATAVEAALAEGTSAAEAAVEATVGTSPVGDLAGSAEYRQHLARVLTERALLAVERSERR